MIGSRRGHLLSGPSSSLMRAAGAAAAANARKVGGRQVQQQMQRLVQLATDRPSGGDGKLHLFENQAAMTGIPEGQYHPRAKTFPA